jgi:hypothetical protein
MDEATRRFGDERSRFATAVRGEATLYHAIYIDGARLAWQKAINNKGKASRAVHCCRSID